MRLTMRAESPIERLALAFNLAPTPVGEMMFGMPATRCVLAGVQLGLFARLAQRPGTAPELAAEMGLQEDGLRLLLDSLAAQRHVDRRNGRYELTHRARRWLDPASKTYVGTFIEHAVDYWEWWGHLEEVVRTGKSFEIHAAEPGDPHWRRYIVGQYELARLSAPEVARALKLPPSPRALLDVAGAHGWFSAELCRRHPTLQATVIDLPGSAAVGREIIAEAGMSDRVHHKEGDMFTTDFGGPYEGALCFNIIHHFDPERIVALFRRVHAALAPGGAFAILDLFLPPSRRRPDTGAFLGLFFYLTSGAATYTPEDLRGWLHEAGFATPRRVPIRSIPNQTLYVAIKRG